MRRSRVFDLTSVALIASVALIDCHRKEAVQLADLQADMETAQFNLSRFDDLDFNVISGQRWELLGKSHTQDVVVHWPGGRTTHGLDEHEQELKAFFAWAPDTRISDHPIKVANGEWTAVTAVLEGTFTRPMPMPEGRNIAPTHRSFRLPTATFAHWTDGVMDEVHVFWDNQSLFEQLGVAEAPAGSWEDPWSYNEP